MGNEGDNQSNTTELSDTDNHSDESSNEEDDKKTEIAEAEKSCCKSYACTICMHLVIVIVGFSFFGLLIDYFQEDGRMSIINCPPYIFIYIIVRPGWQPACHWNGIHS